MAESGGRAMRKRLQMIFQDPYASLNPRWRVGRIIAEPMLTHTTMTPAERTARVGQLLKQVGLDPADQGRYPHQFSAASASASRSRARWRSIRVPGLRRADLGAGRVGAGAGAEPDEGSAAQLGLTYLFISHNLAVVHHVADRVGVMYLGRMVEVAPRDELFARPRHPYTRMLLEAIPDINGAGKPRTAVAGEVPNPLNPPSAAPSIRVARTPTSAARPRRRRRSRPGRRWWLVMRCRRGGSRREAWSVASVSRGDGRRDFKRGQAAARGGAAQCRCSPSTAS